MVLALYWASSNASKHGENPDIIYDFFIVAVIFGIIGARAYYVIFNWDNYSGDLLKIINIREGGLAIYGAVILGIVSAALFCYRRKYPLIKLTDCGLPAVLMAQGIGRWGNFFNCEAFGEYTDSLFAMRIKLSLVNQSMLSQSHLDNLITDGGYEYIQVHPTFLYESSWDLLSFLFLWHYSKKHELGGGGATFGYFILYGIGRFFIEGIRTDQLLIPGSSIPVSQLLSFILVIASFGAMLYMRNKKKNLSA